ncbi:hypothetical protein ROR02_13860 [Pararhodospirillum oryzae]|uniref:Uncharacterized protein n=1 Tax=Pararhodospirillum oryzae TaxID=478448 RepID=A0A512H706_9PROT|nr:hypothetical protein ROR02_13860 [Pararhodospirillum oryzae]
MIRTRARGGGALDVMAGASGLSSWRGGGAGSGTELARLTGALAESPREARGARPFAGSPGWPPVIAGGAGANKGGTQDSRRVLGTSKALSGTAGRGVRRGREGGGAVSRAKGEAPEAGEARPAGLVAGAPGTPCLSSEGGDPGA